MDGGGGTSTGGVFTVGGTIGQPDEGAMSGGNYQGALLRQRHLRQLQRSQRQAGLRRREQPGGVGKVAQLPIQTWAYKSDPHTKHLGPVAQDFHAAFGLGTDDKHIATVDADGVAVAAIQGLNQKLEEEIRAKGKLRLLRIDGQGNG